MAKITILPEDIVNKIAAGEVVERPASVVKELLENSLDANSTEIKIELKNSGKELIKITDNGEGMDPEDALISLKKNATSKISQAEDLFSINTLGFRGEALASIAAISRLTLTTKKKGTLEAFKLQAEGGFITNTTIASALPGTTIEVKDLFFNTPARKKFLKTDAVELRHILDAVTNYALLNKHVDITLLHENHTLLHSPSNENQRQNIASLFGAQLAKDLIEVDYKNDLITVSGLICKPYQARNDKSQQVLFVNNRWIKNNNLRTAIYEGYHSMLFVNKHPIFFLSITLNPEQVDVNVHPQKSEIKIEQSDTVCNHVKEAIKEALTDNNLIPVVEVEQQITFGTPKHIKKKEPVKYSFEPSEQRQLEPENIIVSEEKLHSIIQEEVEETPTNLPPFKLLGQFHKTFWAAETEGGIFFIDQHAAHERVMYEKFMAELHDNKVNTQALLQPEFMELTAAEAAIVNNHIDEMHMFGFSVEHFGGNSFILKTIPIIFGRLQPAKLFTEFLHELQEGNNTIMDMKETIITRMACRSAVMAGDELPLSQMQDIMNKLAKTKNPYTCPHGRPSIIKTTADELEKKFRRK